MDKLLTGQRVMIMVANGFNEDDMTVVQKSLAEAGALAQIISPENGLTNSWNEAGWGHHYPVDGNIGEVLSVDFDRIVILGGLLSVNKLVSNPHVERILSGFMAAEKPIALMGESASLLPEAKMTDGEVSLNGMILTGDVKKCRTEFVEQMIDLFSDQVEFQQAA